MTNSTWLNGIPENWRRTRLKHLARFQAGDNITAESIRQEGDYPVYGGNGLRGFTDAYSHDGDYVLLGRQGALCGNINYAHGKFWASEHAVVVKPNPKVVERWLGELLRAMDLRQYSMSAAQPGLSVEYVTNLPAPLPPLETQHRIAYYLDRETARIDALIAAKEQLLAIMAEKRRALITRAVTRGLNPDVPLRDSGLPWLAKIPEHWELVRLKFYLTTIEQGWSPQCDSFPAENDEWGVLKVGSVNGWEFNPHENKRLPLDMEPLTEYEIQEGDVLVSRANTTELLGSAAFVRRVRPMLLLCHKLYRLRLTANHLVPEYLVRYLRSSPGHYEFERDATGASNSMQNIGQDSVRNIWIALPPLDEQHEIVAEITLATRRLDSLDVANRRTIHLLKERRSALIAAAVTGQLAVEG